MSYTYECIQAKLIKTDSDGKAWYRAVIVTDNTNPNPEQIPAGAIEDFPPEANLAAGSVILYPTDKHKIVYTDTSTRPGPDPEEDETMKINLTYDATAKTLTMDQTAQEIMTAINDGKAVVAVCADPAFLAAWTAVEGATGTMSGHVTTVYALEGEGTVVDAITSNGSNVSAGPLQLSFLQAEGEGQYPVYQMA